MDNFTLEGKENKWSLQTSWWRVLPLIVWIILLDGFDCALFGSWRVYQDIKHKQIRKTLKKN